MTGFNYVRSQSTADRLIQKFGRTAILQVKKARTGDVFDPDETGVDEYPCKIAVLDYETKLIDGKLIKIGDKQVYLSAKDLSIVPDPSSHKLVIDGVSHQLIPPLKQLNPAGIVVYYVLQARE